MLLTWVAYLHSPDNRIILAASVASQILLALRLASSLKFLPEFWESAAWFFPNGRTTVTNKDQESQIQLPEATEKPRKLIFLYFGQHLSKVGYVFLCLTSCPHTAPLSCPGVARVYFAQIVGSADDNLPWSLGSVPQVKWALMWLFLAYCGL